MFIDFPQLAYQVHQSLRAQDAKMPAGHVQQLLCALLGYKSLAGMQAATSIESPGVAGARFIIFNEALALTRSQQLGCDSDVVATIIAAFKRSAQGQASLYTSEQHFLDDYLQEELQFGGELTDVLSGRMAEMNAYGPAWVDLEFDEPTPIDDDPHAPWLVAMSGVLTMEADRERPFCGGKVAFEGHVEYERAGLRLLMAEPTVQASGQVADF